MEIKITCKDTGTTSSLDDLHIIQGNLKTLSEENYFKLKNSIIKHGFFCPFHVWYHNGIYNLLDGTQRKLTLTKMRDEGIDLPTHFPVVVIEAKNYSDAKNKLLAITSQFGKITKEGINEFIEDVDFEIDDLISEFDFDAIKLESMVESELKDISENLDNDDFEDVKEKKQVELKMCPQCGFEL